ncbi:hypothetical protein HMP09_1423 [Sphingomonas sp. HMP9]|nr:hypothetical protein HMP09_1423 [Sphingomonas sp. HMP9]
MTTRVRTTPAEAGAQSGLPRKSNAATLQARATWTEAGLNWHGLSNQLLRQPKFRRALQPPIYPSAPTPIFSREGGSSDWIPAFAGKQRCANYRGGRNRSTQNPRERLYFLYFTPPTPPNPKHEAPR